MTQVDGLTSRLLAQLANPLKLYGVALLGVFDLKLTG